MEEIISLINKQKQIIHFAQFPSIVLVCEQESLHDSRLLFYKIKKKINYLFKVLPTSMSKNLERWANKNIFTDAKSLIWSCNLIQRKNEC